MRKVLIGIFLLLLGLCAASPWFIGYQVKTNFYEVVNALSQNNKNIKVSILEYKLGWLSSDAKIQITMQLPPQTAAATPAAAQLQNLTETIDNHINHGPLVQDPAFGRWMLAMAAIESKIFLSGFEYTSKASDHSLSQITTLVDFRNKWHSQFNQPGLSFSISTVGQISLQGVSGNADFTLNKNRIDQADLSFEMKGLVLTFTAGPPISEINLDSMKYENHSILGDSGVWTGKVKMTLPNLVIKKKDNSQITLQDGVLENTVSSPNPNLYGFSGNFAFKNIQTANEVLPSLGPLQFTVAANNLNLSGVEALSTFFKSVHQPITREDQMAYMNLLPKILSPTTLITGNLTSNTSFGAVLADASLSWKADPALPTTLQEMAQQANATITIRVASALVDKIIAAHDGPAATVTAAPAPTSEATTPADQTAAPVNPGEKAATPADTAAASTESPSSAAASADSVITATDQNQGPSPFRPVFDSWIQQGYVSKDGDNYVVLIKHENGLTTINGKTPQQ